MGRILGHALQRFAPPRRHIPQDRHRRRFDGRDRLWPGFVGAVTHGRARLV
jgi:hypothetical protein